MRRLNPDGTRTILASGLVTPVDLTFDSAGNLFVADASGGFVIRKIPAGGTMVTLAGAAGQSGSTDGMGSLARFTNPNSVSVDQLGNVFVADEYANVIRKVSPEGLVTTVGGLNGAGGNADGLGATARFRFPRRAVVDGAGNLYVADTGNHTLRKGTPFIPPTTPPALQVRREGDRIVLAWPASNAEFDLERRATLGPTDAWSPVISGLFTNGDTLVLTNATPGSGTFFRLRKP